MNFTLRTRSYKPALPALALGAVLMLVGPMAAFAQRGNGGQGGGNSGRSFSGGGSRYSGPSAGRNYSGGGRTYAAPSGRNYYGGGRSYVAPNGGRNYYGGRSYVAGVQISETHLRTPYWRERPKNSVRFRKSEPRRVFSSNGQTRDGLALRIACDTCYNCLSHAHAYQDVLSRTGNPAQPLTAAWFAALKIAAGVRDKPFDWFRAI